MSSPTNGPSDGSSYQSIDLRSLASWLELSDRLPMVHGSHHSDPGEHRRAATLRNQHQGLSRGLPVRQLLLGLGQARDVLAGLPERPRGPARPSTPIGSSKDRPSPWSFRVSIPHRCNLRLIPIEVGPNIGAAATATLTDEARLDICQPNIVTPTIRGQRDVMAAMAIDQDAAQAHLAHLAERDLDRAAVGRRWRVAADRARHACIGARRGPESNRQSLGSRSGTSTLSIGDVENTSRGGEGCGQPEGDERPLQVRKIVA